MVFFDKLLSIDHPKNQTKPFCWIIKKKKKKKKKTDPVVNVGVDVDVNVCERRIVKD